MTIYRITATYHTNLLGDDSENFKEVELAHADIDSALATAMFYNGYYWSVSSPGQQGLWTPIGRLFRFYYENEGSLYSEFAEDAVQALRLAEMVNAGSNYEYSPFVVTQEVVPERDNDPYVPAE